MSDLLTLLTESLAGTYAVERELGRGGMATVFLARDVKHGRQVAIKVLHPELASSMGAGRFTREIEIAARLQHPNILPLYDSGAAGEFLYYVMPFVEGEALRDRMDREKQLGLEDAIKITLEVAAALSYAHSRGVVHRDIKPENVLLSGGVAVVADFGIARALSAASDQTLTQTGTVVGTPAYMSPEQASGSPDIDGRSDQYSLACMLYEMLVGAPPFTGPTAMAVMARHSMDMVSPPTIVRATIPDAVEDALLKALNKVPADRFATAQQFAEALLVPSAATGPQRRLPTGGAVARPRATGEAGPPIWRRLSRRTVAAGAGGLMVVAVAAWAAQRLVSGGRHFAEGPDPSRIAVLYFADQSEDQKLGYLADGFTEALIDELAQVKGLQVISRNGVAPFKNARVAPDSIARALEVGTLVEGSVAQSRDTLQLRVALISAATGARIGSTTLKRPRGDLFALQDSVAQEVAFFLRRRLGAEVQLREARARGGNVEAWELVQQAEQATKTVDPLLAAADTGAAGRELARADSLLARAEALDKNWMTPIVQRGWIQYRRRQLVGTFDKVHSAQWIDSGLAHAERALQRQPRSADALALRGTLRYWRYVLNLAPHREAPQLLASAEQDLREATSIDQRQAFAWQLLSHLLMRRSETAEGKIAARNAYDADPYLTNANFILYRLTTSSMDLDDASEARRWCDEGQRRFPQDPLFVECQILLFALKGQQPDVPHAWRLLDQYIASYPPAQRDFRRLRGRMMVAMALARAGLADSARAVALRSRGDGSIDPARDLTYLEVLLRGILGDGDEALRLLSLYLATNPQDRESVARDQSWWFAGLREDARFKQLVGVGPGG